MTITFFKPKNTTAPRPRAKHAFLAAIMLAATGCTVSGTGGSNIPQEAIDHFGNMTAKEIMPMVGPKTFIAAFSNYCANNVTNPAKIKALLKRDGYVPITNGRNGITVFAHRGGKPVIGLGRRAGKPDLCMVISRKNKALKPAANAYVRNRHGKSLTAISDPPSEADQAWMVFKPSPIIYITVTENDRELGPIYAFAIGKAQ